MRRLTGPIMATKPAPQQEGEPLLPSTTFPPRWDHLRQASASRACSRPAQDGAHQWLVVAKHGEPDDGHLEGTNQLPKVIAGVSFKRQDRGIQVPESQGSLMTSSPNPA